MIKIAIILVSLSSLQTFGKIWISGPGYNCIVFNGNPDSFISTQSKNELLCSLLKTSKNSIICTDNVAKELQKTMLMPKKTRSEIKTFHYFKDKHSCNEAVSRTTKYWLTTGEKACFHLPQKRLDKFIKTNKCKNNKGKGSFTSIACKKSKRNYFVNDNFIACKSVVKMVKEMKEFDKKNSTSRKNKSKNRL